MIKALVNSSKIVINNSLSACEDPPNGINCVRLGGAAGTRKDRLRTPEDLYHQQKWFKKSSLRS